MTLPKIPESTCPEGEEINAVSEGMCVIFAYVTTAGIEHREVVEE